MIAYILGGALMLGMCIFIHEMGHYLMGRLVGVKAEIFSIGYGRGIWKKKIGDTTWQITAIPFGGYVKFYGDDYAGDKVEGGFLSTPPLRRIIPVLGGPFFNLLLAIVIFFILHMSSGPLSTRVYFWEESLTNTPAYKSGLRQGDVITAIDGQPVKDFYDLKQQIALSGGKPLSITAVREGSAQNFKVIPEVDQAGRASIGLRVPGEQYIEVNYPTSQQWSYRIDSILGEANPPKGLKALPYLNQGDVILRVAGQEVHSILELQKLLGEHHGETVSVEVDRRTMPWLAPWFTKRETIQVPTSKEFKIYLTGLIDEKYKRSIGDQVFLSNRDEHQRGLNYLKIDGEAPGSFERLYEKFETGEKASIDMEGKTYTGFVRGEKIGLFGFMPNHNIQSEYIDRNHSVTEALALTARSVYDNVAVYPKFFGSLISGRLSFIDNAMGPVGMFAVAGAVVKSGIQDYLQLFAAISVALMVMNLLPIPVVDGGHIVFFLYEAIAGKPLALRAMEAIHRVAFSLLMFLGLWIMYKDILFVFAL